MQDFIQNLFCAGLTFPEGKGNPRRNRLWIKRLRKSLTTGVRIIAQKKKINYREIDMGAKY
jgi:hypothetical protein